MSIFSFNKKITDKKEDKEKYIPTYNVPNPNEGKTESNYKKEETKSTPSAPTASGGNFDYSTLINDAILRGDKPSTVSNLLSGRNSKIAADSTLSQYAYDDTYNRALQYIRDNESYEGKYDNDVDAILKRMKNRDSFEYDFEKDPLYQQYKTQAMERGAMTTNDTLARAAQMGGGMSSYALSAAQMANNAYNQQINDIIPELYNLAYEKYLNEGQQDYNLLSALQNQDQLDYSRYIDNRNFKVSNEQTGYDRFNDKRSWEYTLGKDAIENERYDKEWDYNVSENERNRASDIALGMINNGDMPSDELLEAAGIPKDDAKTWVNGVKSQMYSSSSRGGGSGSNSSDWDTYNNMLAQFSAGDTGPREYIQKVLKPVFAGEEDMLEQDLVSSIVENSQKYNIDKADAELIYTAIYGTPPDGWLDEFEDGTGDDIYGGFHKKK